MCLLVSACFRVSAFPGVLFSQRRGHMARYPRVHSFELWLLSTPKPFHGFRVSGLGPRVGVWGLGFPV